MLRFCQLKLTCFCQNIFIFVNIYSICILKFYKKVWARHEIYVAWQYMYVRLTNVGPLPIIVILFLLKPTYICKYLFQIFIFTFITRFGHFKSEDPMVLIVILTSSMYKKLQIIDWSSVSFVRKR